MFGQRSLLTYISRERPFTVLSPVTYTSPKMCTFVCDRFLFIFRFPSTDVCPYNTIYLDMQRTWCVFLTRRRDSWLAQAWPLSTTTGFTFYHPLLSYTTPTCKETQKSSLKFKFAYPETKIKYKTTGERPRTIGKGYCIYLYGCTNVCIYTTARGILLYHTCCRLTGAYRSVWLPPCVFGVP